MHAASMADAYRFLDESNAAYTQFLNMGTMSLGIYRLGAGEVDPQQPHAEDEIYIIVEGRGKIEVAGERRMVGPGDAIFVGASVDHRFVDIEESLTMYVIFAPEHVLQPD